MSEKCIFGLSHALKNHLPGLPFPYHGHSVLPPTTSDQAHLWPWSENPLNLPTRKNPKMGGTPKSGFSKIRAFFVKKEGYLKQKTILGLAGLRRRFLIFRVFLPFPVPKFKNFH